MCRLIQILHNFIFPKYMWFLYLYIVQLNGVPFGHRDFHVCQDYDMHISLCMHISKSVIITYQLACIYVYIYVTWLWSHICILSCKSLITDLIRGIMLTVSCIHLCSTDISATLIHLESLYASQLLMHLMSRCISVFNHVRASSRYII